MWYKKRITRNLKKIGSIVYVNGNLVCLRRACEAEYQVGAILCKKGAFHGETMLVEEEHLEHIGRDT